MNEFHPPRHGLRSMALACGGIFAAIGLLAYCSFDLHVLLVLGSFGSSSVILFAFPDSHFAQPQSVIGGHAISSGIGLLVLALCGATWWSLALAVALSAAAMMISRTVHPPAGSNPIIVFLAAPGTLGWQFLLFPTLFGTVALVATGVLYHRASGHAYPLYWRAGKPAAARRAASGKEERQAA
jgi:CBS-domain-containing membrane protein